MMCTVGNQLRSSRGLRCMIVPAVTGICRPQTAATGAGGLSSSPQPVTALPARLSLSRRRKAGASDTVEGQRIADFRGGEVAHPEGVCSNELFEELAHWNELLKAQEDELSAGSPGHRQSDTLQAISVFVESEPARGCHRLGTALPRRGGSRRGGVGTVRTTARPVLYPASS